MKKVAFCSMVVLLAFGNAWGAECRIVRDFAVTNNNWNADSNEYLFPTERDYLDSTNEANVWQCGMGNCPDKSFKCLGPGHTFKSNTPTERKCYKCNAPWVGDRYWEVVSNTSGLTECNNMKRETGWFQDAEANEYLYPTNADYNSVKSRRTGKVYECDSSACPYDSTVTLSGGHYFEGKKIGGGRTYKCISGDKWVDITDDIVVVAEPAANEVTPTPDKYIEPDKKPKKKPDDKTPKVEDCEYKFNAIVKCGTKRVEMSKSLILQADDLNGIKCEDFNKQFGSDINTIQKLVEKYDLCAGVVKEVTDFTAENAARDKLEAFFKKIDGDRSVWKNADGSFNAARLASDLTAGVVLGTVGGVVSGVLIKKSQVEKGFDALNCTINGQKVADWGDEFSVKFRM